MIENVKSNASTLNARSTDLNVEVGSNTLEFGQFIDESAIVLHRYTQITVMKMEALNESFGRFAVEWTKKQNALKEKAISLMVCSQITVFTQVYQIPQYKTMRV